MDFIIGNYYLITFNVIGKSLTFTCKIISENNLFLKFIDKYGAKLNYNKNMIASFKEIKDKNMIASFEKEIKRREVNDIQI